MEEKNGAHELISDIAKAILSYNPEEQNEIVRRIHEIVKDQRIELCKEAEKQLAYLENTLEQLQ